METKIATWSEAFLPDQKLPKNEYAYAMYKNLMLAKKQQDVLFLIIGRLLKEIKEQKLFEVLDYDTFTDFIYSEELGFSGESAWLYIRVYEYYIETLQLKEDYVAALPVSRLSMMIPVLKKIESKEKRLEEIEKMKSLRNNDFLLKLRQMRRTDKPVVYFKKELNKWIVEFYENCTQLNNLGQFADYQEK